MEATARGLRCLLGAPATCCFLWCPGGDDEDVTFLAAGVWNSIGVVIFIIVFSVQRYRWEEGGEWVNAGRRKKLK